jgi:seryl-tRNA(Sec) selenium transferase
VHASPVTLSEKNRLYRRSKENDMELLVDILIMKATDEHGVKLFTIEHKPTLLNKADSNVVGRIANAILADDAPKVDDLKN